MIPGILFGYAAVGSGAGPALAVDSRAHGIADIYRLSDGSMPLNLAGLIRRAASS